MSYFLLTLLKVTVKLLYHGLDANNRMCKKTFKFIHIFTFKLQSSKIALAHILEYISELVQHK